MLRFLSVCVMSAMALAACGSESSATPDASVTPDASETAIDMGSFMFRDSSTATCAVAGENCLGLPCCGALMCVVPVNGGSPTCQGFLSDGGSPDAAPPIDAAVDAAPDAAFSELGPECLEADGSSPEGWYTAEGTFICEADCFVEGVAATATYNHCDNGLWQTFDGPGCDGNVILAPSVTSRRRKC